MKNEPKKERFWERKTCQNHVRVIKIKVFRFLKKVEKSMPKWLPKVIQNRPKSTMGPSRFDLFIDFIDFGPCRKKHVFSIGPKATQQKLKINQNAPKGRTATPGESQRCTLWGRGSEGRRPIIKEINRLFETRSEWIICHAVGHKARRIYIISSCTRIADKLIKHINK